MPKRPESDPNEFPIPSLPKRQGELPYWVKRKLQQLGLSEDDPKAVKRVLRDARELAEKYTGKIDN